MLRRSGTLPASGAALPAAEQTTTSTRACRPKSSGDTVIRSLTLSLALATAAAPAAAEAIAFAQAPEMSFGIGLGGGLAEAIDRAMEDCGHPGDCVVTTACSPAGWSVDVFLQHREGLHWHEIFCGFDSRETAEAIVPQLCSLATRPYLIDCMLSQVWNPDGIPQIQW